MPGSAAVFLDRDGILNRAIIIAGMPRPPATAHQLEIIPGMDAELQRLRAAEYLLLGITNQPDVARGTQDRAVVESINSHILSQLPLREILVCYHDDQDDCECRKPRPGLILRAAQQYGVDLSRSWMVGDRWKDIAAGRAAGLRTIFVDYRYSEAYNGPPADFSVGSPQQIAEIVLRGLL